MALPPPFPTKSVTPGFVPAGALEKALRDKLAKSKFSGDFAHMGIALADLTSIAEDPTPSGSFSVPLGSNALVDSEVAVGSLSKIHCMFAAYFLKEQVTKAAAGVGGQASDVQDLIAKITADWGTTVRNKIAKTPHDFPDLAHIFQFNPKTPWEPDFRNDFKSWQDLDDKHDKGRAVIDTLEFMDRMKLMVRFSDNMASGSCVRDIGFQYLNGALAAHGFADNAKNGVLWLGGDFGYDDSKSPIMGAPPWDKNADATWVRANARGIASYLTLVWTNRLVSQDASQDMRDILRDRSVGYATYIGNATPNRLRTFSKIGLLGHIISEGVIIEAKNGATAIRYAAVGLRANRSAVMKELATIFYDVIASLH
ncbi:MAG TPA: serine hydrolase [Gemmataceae bacterium]|nr:serine hydrolase [Gemmataceae bacterium]